MLIVQDAMMLQTFGCRLHGEDGASRFVPIMRESLVEALQAAREMLSADPTLERIEIHPCAGGVFEVLRSTAL
jgi:hypothetical protein